MVAFSTPSLPDSGHAVVAVATAQPRFKKICHEIRLELNQDLKNQRWMFRLISRTCYMSKTFVSCVVNCDHSGKLSRCAKLLSDESVDILITHSDMLRFQIYFNLSLFSFFNKWMTLAIIGKQVSFCNDIKYLLLYDTESIYYLQSFLSL